MGLTISFISYLLFGDYLLPPLIIRDDNIREIKFDD
jgi:hypothetical protein